MHNGMGSVQQNGKELMRKYTLTYQLMQAFKQLTRSRGINPMSYSMCAILWSPVYQTFGLL